MFLANVYSVYNSVRFGLGVNLNTPNEKLKILIVDDDELDRLLIKRALSKSDIVCTTEAAATREEYLAQLDQFGPDIILCDYSIPQFGALEALKILKDAHSEVPLIIVTGALTDELAVEGL